MNHIEYILRKRDKSIKTFNKFMKRSVFYKIEDLEGNFKDID